MLSQRKTVSFQNILNLFYFVLPTCLFKVLKSIHPKSQEFCVCIFYLKYNSNNNNKTNKKTKKQWLSPKSKRSKISVPYKISHSHLGIQPASPKKGQENKQVLQHDIQFSRSRVCKMNAKLKTLDQKSPALIPSWLTRVSWKIKDLRWSGTAEGDKSQQK